ncbi:MAG: hypothetical protein Kow00121_40280 [Elainellaceae cyanobacterium]
MGRLAQVIGITFFASLLMCWILTTDWIPNPLASLVLAIGGSLAIGIWGMDSIEGER